MRVLHVVESFAGGTGRHVVDLAEGLCSKGIEVAVAYSPIRAESRLVATLKDTLGQNAIKIPMGRSLSSKDMAAATTLKQVYADHGPFPVVHGHSSKGGFLARMTAPQGSARVYTPHLSANAVAKSRSARLAYAALERSLARWRTEAMIAVSALEHEGALASGVAPEIVHRVPNGLPQVVPERRTDARRRLGIRDEELVVGFVGRLCYQKNPRRFLEVLSEAREELPNLVGVLIGDGDSRKDVERTVTALGLERATRLVRHPAAFELMPAFDIYCLTSRAEGMPYVLLEALACGLPIVSTAVGGVEELVRDNWNGVVAREEPITSTLASAIVRIMSDPVARMDMGEKSLRLAQDFTVDRMVDSTLDVYASAMDRLQR